MERKTITVAVASSRAKANDLVGKYVNAWIQNVDVSTFFVRCYRDQNPTAPERIYG